MLIELVSWRGELRLLVFPCYALWISLIWGLSYSKEKFSSVPCYFFSKIRWNNCVLVWGHDLLSLILLVFWGRTKCIHVYVFSRNVLASLLFLSMIEDESRWFYVSLILLFEISNKTTAVLANEMLGKNRWMLSVEVGIMYSMANWGGLY